MRTFLIISLFIFSQLLNAQVKIRLFSDQRPESVFVTLPVAGRNQTETVMISKYENRLAVKHRNQPGYIVDSLILTGTPGEDSFILSVNGQSRVYSGSLKCFPDLGTIVLINECDTEKYVAGVVKAEGGSGKNVEYFKTQAVIVRTYLNKYMSKHLPDGYNLCDGTHCQVYHGICDNELIKSATEVTKGLVIVGNDSALIVSAFHSNCGGETASSEDVWLSSASYLKKVNDPYCSGSRNSTWQRKISATEWVKTLSEVGYKGTGNDLSVFAFSQLSREASYSIGSFTIPLTILRDRFNLRSTWFSVVPDGDSVILKGRGYGHGVGLCQEGAMAMASKGFGFRQIISFYYPGVTITDISAITGAETVFTSF